jgi:hypothetical protein
MRILLCLTTFVSVATAMATSVSALQPPASRLTVPELPVPQLPVLGIDGSDTKESSLHLPARHLAVAASAKVPSDFHASPQLEVYGNFHTIGLIASIPKELTATDISTMRSYMNVDGQWRPRHDLVQVGDFPWFATSIFWLQPNSTYQFKVEVVGLDHKVMAVWYGEGNTRQDPVLHQSSDSLYVAKNGDDRHPGTKERPFKTIARGFSAVTAGQTLFIREGQYHEGRLELAHDGQQHAPIVIRAFPGEKVIIDGTDPEMSDWETWRSDGAGVFSTPCQGNYRAVTAIRQSDDRATRLFPVLELKHLQNRAIPEVGTFRELGIEGAVFCDGQRIHISFQEPLDGHVIHVSGFDRGIVLDTRNHVQIDGLELNHYGRDESSCAIYVLNSSDILIQNCTFRYDDSQIYAKLNSDRLTVQNCLFTDDIFEWPFDYMKGDSGLSGRFEGGAINVDSKFNGRGLVFRRNRIRNFFDGVHLTPWTVNNARTNEIDFYENIIDGCIDDFVEADGYSRNVRIFDNYMNRSLSGISVAQALDGPTFIMYNVIGNCGMVPASQRPGSENAGYPFKTNGGAGAETGSGPLYFYHNTAFTLDPESRAMLVKNAKWKKMTLRNNIWVGQKLGLDLWMANPSPIDFDYDNLFVKKPAEPLVLQAYRKKSMTLKEVQERYGWLTHGISADPLFRNAGGGDFSLSDRSPCIDAGLLLFGINDLRVKGSEPDIGAFESQ